MREGEKLKAQLGRPKPASNRLRAIGAPISLDR